MAEYEGDYDYRNAEDCIADRVHLTNVDDDGCCNFCGYTEA